MQGLGPKPKNLEPEAQKPKAPQATEKASPWFADVGQARKGSVEGVLGFGV